MADKYLRPGESALAPADETPISGENLEKQADEFFDVDQELSSGLMESTERDMRRQLKFKGGMLLQDDDGSVFDAGAIFEDSKGETHSLEVGDPLPGYEGYLVSEIRPGRKGGVEVELLGRRGKPVIFGTGPTSGGRGFGEARAKREAMAQASRIGQLMTKAFAGGMGSNFIIPKELYDYEEEAVPGGGEGVVEGMVKRARDLNELRFADDARRTDFDSINELLEVAEEEESYLGSFLRGELGLTSSFEPAKYMDALSVLENDASRLFRELSEIENGE